MINQGLLEGEARPVTRPEAIDEAAHGFCGVTIEGSVK